MQVENYEIYKTLEEVATINEKGEKVVPVNYVKYLLRYYFDYPVRSKRRRYFMEKDINGDLCTGTIYPDKTRDIDIGVKKRILINKFDKGTIVEREAIYRAIEEVATQIGLALIDKNQAKLYIMVTDDWPLEQHENISQVIVLGKFKFNAYLSDSEMIKTPMFEDLAEKSKIKKMVSELFEEKQKEDEYNLFEEDET